MKPFTKFLALALVLPLSLSLLGGCAAPEKKEPAATTEKNTPAAAGLKDDYYAAVNKEVLEKNDAEKTGGWNWFYDLEEKSNQEQQKLIQQAAAHPGEKGSSAYKLGILYKQALDQDKRDAAGVRYFNELMKPVLEARTIQELLDAAASLQYQYGFDSLLNPEVLVLDETPDRYSVRLKDMNVFLDSLDFQDAEYEAENRKHFTGYLAELRRLAGQPEDPKTIEQIYAFAKATATGRGETKPARISLEELQKKLPQLDVKRYFEKLLPVLPETITVPETDSLTVLNRYLKEENLPLLKEYLYLANLEKLAPYLTSQMQQARLKMEEDYVGEAEPADAEKTAVKQTAELLKWDLGKLYTEANYTPEKKKAVKELPQEIIEEYETMLQEADWLSEPTRQKAIEKLKGIRVRIGAPDDIDRYLSSYVPDPEKSYLENVLALRQEASRKQYDQFGQPVDRTVWNILPQELTPSYYPTDNSINIPVSVMEKPYLDPAANEARNLGALGTIIGHEVTHAFDDLGSQYDKNGDFVNWWSEKDRQAFDKRAEKIVTFYDNYKTPGIMQQDGRQTLGENIADLGAMRALSRIVARRHLPAREFFESYANIWASTSNPLTDAMVSGMDEHAADKARVNAVLSNTDLFYTTYGIQEGDKMYLAPENRVGLW